MSNKSIGTEPVYDARTLGAPRMFVLGLQHMFAMFGATVLVPALTGLDVATTLLFAGLGTLLFHLLAKGKVPAFLGSSFAFIGGYNAVRTIGTNPDGSAIYNNDLLAYACFGVAIAGLMYVILSTLFKVFGVKKVMRYFPPIVTGPIIIAIGLTLSSSAITNCRANWLIAIVAILIVIGFNMWGKGMAKIIPILLGVLGSYIFAIIIDPAERASVAAAVALDRCVEFVDAAGPGDVAVGRAFGAQVDAPFGALYECDLLRNGLPVLLGADREFARQGFGSGVDQGLDQQGVAVLPGDGEPVAFGGVVPAVGVRRHGDHGVASVGVEDHFLARHLHVGLAFALLRPDPGGFGAGCQQCGRQHCDAAYYRIFHVRDRFVFVYSFHVVGILS